MLADSTRRALSHWVTQTQAAARQPSLVAAAARDGEVVWWHGAGSVDGRGGATPTAGTAYRIASITKTFVAVAVLRLVESGRLDLGDAVGAVVPEAPGAQATIAQLLSHTSGLQAETDGAWWERSDGRTWDELTAAGLTRRLPAGRAYHYSNVGYAVLGRLLETIHRQPWDEVLAREVIRPLGLRGTGRVPDSSMAAVGWAVHPHADLLHREPVPDYRAMGAAGELWSTVADLAVWGSFLAGRRDGPLGPELVAQMRSPWAVADHPGQPWTGGHGLGLQVVNLGGRRYAGHTGSVPGFTSELRFSADTGDVVVALGSATGGFGGVTELVEVLESREPAEVEAFAADPSQAPVLDLVGTWYWGTATYVIAARPGCALDLTVVSTGRVTRFVPDGADRWLGQSGYFFGEALRVVRDGPATWLDIASFRVTRTPYDPVADLPGGADHRGWH